MLGKIWKKVLLFILIVACLFNIVKKLVQRESLKSELESTLNYFSKQKETMQNEENTVKTNQINNNVQNNAEIIDTNQANTEKENNNQVLIIEENTESQTEQKQVQEQSQLEQGQEQEQEQLQLEQSQEENN